MNKLISKYTNKIFFKKWIIGLCSNTTITDIIKTRTFDPEIKWIKTKSVDKFYADPFPYIDENGSLRILCESFDFGEDYGKISLLAFDASMKPLQGKVLLDTQSHLSYPLIFKNDGKTYVFPEASKSGKLSCYEYDSVHESLHFLQDIIDKPLLDATIIKNNGLYWVFGSIRPAGKNDYQLYIFYSQNLLGPYTEHAENPVRNGLDGIRSAGKFIEVEGTWYRPAQNCKSQYGESVTINKITELTITTFREEGYMDVRINPKRNPNNGMHTLHTINSVGGLIVLDGEYWFFSPFQQMKKFIKNILEPKHPVHRN
ncbi:MAG TPA: hypothetical protein VIJ92_09775 [Ginsengibacter sp.]